MISLTYNRLLCEWTSNLIRGSDNSKVYRSSDEFRFIIQVSSTIWDFTSVHVAEDSSKCIVGYLFIDWISDYQEYATIPLSKWINPQTRHLYDFKVAASQKERSQKWLSLSHVLAFISFFWTLPDENVNFYNRWDNYRSKIRQTKIKTDCKYLFIPPEPLRTLETLFIP